MRSSIIEARDVEGSTYRIDVPSASTAWKPASLCDDAEMIETPSIAGTGSSGYVCVGGRRRSRVDHATPDAE